MGDEVEDRGVCLEFVESELMCRIQFTLHAARDLAPKFRSDCLAKERVTE